MLSIWTSLKFCFVVKSCVAMLDPFTNDKILALKSKTSGDDKINTETNKF